MQANCTPDVQHHATQYLLELDGEILDLPPESGCGEPTWTLLRDSFLIMHTMLDVYICHPELLTQVRAAVRAQLDTYYFS